MIEYGIYVHKNMPKDVRLQARNLYDTCQKNDKDTFFKEFEYPGDLSFSPKTQKAIVMGGDGTIRTCLEWWDKTNSPTI